MTLPTFLVIGAMKAGTTSLHAYLSSHPHVFMPAEKELDFFVEERRWDLGERWYREQFEPGRWATARGEASTNYTKFPLFRDVPARAASLVPEARLVYVVRMPIERIRSNYIHARSAGWERRSFDNALRAEPQYVDVSRYATQLRLWLEWFPPERVLVIAAEDLRTRRLPTVQRVFEFVGADPSWEPPDLDEELHPSHEKIARRPAALALRQMPGARSLRRIVPAGLRRAYGDRTTTALDPDRLPLSSATRRWLAEQLQPEIVELRRLSGLTLDGWDLA